jgi:hypothetical protein
MSIAKLKELDENGYLEINVENHETIKEGEKIIKRIASNGKELTPKMRANEEKESLESR